MKKILFTIFVLFFLFSSVFVLENFKILAATCNAHTACPDTFVTDFACVQNKIVNPEDSCCVDICPGGNSSTLDPAYEQFNIFVTKININSEHKVAALINVTITTVLGAISLYTLFRGFYIAAYKRANTTDSAEIEKITTELKNLVIGFVICWTFIFVMQFVMTLLGIGNLNQLVILGDPNPSNVIIIN